MMVGRSVRESRRLVDELMGARDWQHRAPETAAAGDETKAVQSLARSVKLHPVVTAILWRRGLQTPAAIQAFLNPALDSLCDPFRLKGMDAAVAAIQAAGKAGERVLVYGDYDVDGVASTALLVRALSALDFDVAYAIPDRLVEGYGLNEEAVRAAAAGGYGLLVTVDNGIGAVAEVRQAREAGLSVVVTDHHQPPPELPPADAVVNPHQPGCDAPFRHWAGVGVTFKLVQALFAATEAPDRPLEWLDLVALGTVADIVPLVGENRVLVHHGLRRLQAETLPGIAALKEVAGLENGELTVRRLAFTLAPRLNAAGRLGDAGPAVELLLTAEAEHAGRLARELDEENRRRQAIGEGIHREVQAELDRHPEWLEGPVLVLAGEGWHTGLVGIVASRLVDRFGRPAILLDLENGTARGSARSIEGFNIYAALRQAEDLLEAFGGHEAAAGLTLPAEHVAPLRERLCAEARRQLPDGPPRPTLAIAASLGPQELEGALVDDLQRLAPFGPGNPRPVFQATLRLAAARRVGGQGEHLKLRLSGGAARDAIGFRMGARADQLAAGEPVEVAFTPEWNTWQGRTRVQLNLHDLRLPRAALRRRMLERLRLNHRLLRQRHPGRTELAAVYKALQELAGLQPLFTADAETCRALQERCGLELPLPTLAAALTIFSEIGLMSTMQRGAATVFLFNAEPEEHVSLDESPRYRRGQQELAATAELLARAERLSPQELAAEAARLGRQLEERDESA